MGVIPRKIQLVGKRSYAISLPKDWVVANKLNPHDEIFLEHGNDNSILIQTQKTPAQQKNRYAINNIQRIDHFLALCYQKNIDTLTFFGNKITNEQRAEVRNMLRNLDGYDIVNETNTEITIAFLFKDINVNLKKIIVRMVYLLKLMVDSVHDHNEFTLIENENALDRLYYLGQRILFASTYNNKARRENDIQNTEDIFFYLHIIKKMEQFGDLLEELKEKKLTKEIHILRECTRILDELFVKGKKASSIKLTASANSTSKSTTIIIDRVINLTHDIILNAMSIEYNAEFFNDRH